jgi:hypothetical protein
VTCLSNTATQAEFIAAAVWADTPNCLIIVTDMIGQSMRTCSLARVQQGCLVAAAATATLPSLISQACCTQWPAQQQHRAYSSQSSQCEQQTVTGSVRASIGDDGLTVTDLPPYIILLRHGEVGTEADLYIQTYGF